MDDRNKDEQLIRLLLSRLERISADSVWAHRASGIRGELLKLLAQYEQENVVLNHEFQQATKSGFAILERAAKESGLSQDKITHEPRSR